MRIELKDLLAYPKYIIRTAWQFVSNPRAWKVVWVILYAFCLTVRVGRQARKVIVSHVGFGIRRGKLTKPRSRKTLARYIWRKTHKYWAPQILEFAGIKTKVYGFDEIDWRSPYIIASNHQSTIDILILVKYIKRAVVVAKKEVLWFPYVGSVARYTQIVVDRNDHAQAIRMLKWAVQEYKGLNILFFAEGTRSETGELGIFKKGAVRTAIDAGVPIIPVTISGAHKALPKGALLKLKLKPPAIKIIFGKPISTEGLTKLDADALNLRLRETIKETLKHEAIKESRENNP